LPRWVCPPLNTPAFPGHASVRRVFPDTAPRLVYQIGPSLLSLRLSLLPACPSHPSGLPLSFVLSAVACTLRSESETSARWSTTIQATSVALPQGPSLQSGLCCPGPSSLNWPHPAHSQAHRNFTGLRFICDAFAVRERLGDPRVVPCFRCIFLPGMSPSESPGSRRCTHLVPSRHALAFTDSEPARHSHRLEDFGAY